MKRCKVGTRRVGKSCRSKGKKKGAKEVKIIYIPGRKVPKAQAAKDEAYLRKHGKKSWRLYGLSGTPEEHSFKGKAALRDAMKHEHAATQAAQSGNCTSAAKHAGQMQFAMGQADAHGVLPNAAYVRMLHVGDKAVNAACSTGAVAGLAGFRWKLNKGQRGVQAPVSFAKHYAVSHRPGEHTVSYRPPGQHHHVGTYKTKAAALRAAEKHHKARK